MTVGGWVISHTTALAIGAGVVGLLMYGCEQKGDGKLEQQIHAREAVIAVQAESLVAVQRRIPQVDTVAGAAAVVFRTSKATYQHIADSITAAMQARGQAPPVQLIQACNAAIAAADTALSACARQVAVRDTALGRAQQVIAGKDTLIHLMEKRKPSHFGCAGPVAVNTKGVGLGVGCGVVIHF